MSLYFLNKAKGKTPRSLNQLVYIPINVLFHIPDFLNTNFPEPDDTVHLITERDDMITLKAK